MANEYNLPPGVTSQTIEDSLGVEVPEHLPGDRIVEVPVLFQVNIDYLLRLTGEGLRVPRIPETPEEVSATLIHQLVYDFEFCDLESAVTIVPIPTLTKRSA